MKKIGILLITIVAFSSTLFAQNDTIKVDSTLLAQQLKSNSLMESNDSITLADSLQQKALLSEMVFFYYFSFLKVTYVTNEHKKWH